MEQVTLVVDDNGYADHKLAWLDDEGKIQTLKIPTIIGTDRLSSNSGETVDRYRANGVEYTCKTSVRSPINLRNANYPASVENRVLVTHALRKAKLLNRPLYLGVTLSFRDYFSDNGQVIAENKQATIANFNGTNGGVDVLGSDDKAEISHVECFSEAVSAFFDFALDEEGEFTEAAKYTKGDVAIIDIGGSTTDVVNLIIDDTITINNSYSGTSKIGVLDLKQQLEKGIKQELINLGLIENSHDAEIPPTLVSEVMETGSTFFAGQLRNFEKLRAEVAGTVATKIINNVKSTLGSIGIYRAIIITGGGSVVFYEWLVEAFPNPVMLDEFSNARGALKFMRNVAAGKIQAKTSKPSSKKAAD